MRVPPAVELASFTVALLPGAIHVQWETATEGDNLGFHLYRADDLQGELVRLNETLIPSKQPGSPIRTQYQCVDRPVEPGVPYYYWLDSLHRDGANSRYGPVSATVGLYRLSFPIVVR